VKINMDIFTYCIVLFKLTILAMCKLCAIVKGKLQDVSMTKKVPKNLGPEMLLQKVTE
jgi:hypothetical protein